VPRFSPEAQDEDVPVAALIRELHLCKTNCNDKKSSMQQRTMVQQISVPVACPGAR
jgi:hypothetical protein